MRLLHLWRKERRAIAKRKEEHQTGRCRARAICQFCHAIKLQRYCADKHHRVEIDMRIAIGQDGGCAQHRDQAA